MARETSWNPKSRTLLWLVAVLSVVSVVTGDCIIGGRRYQENTIWKTGACQTCVCQQGVSVCSGDRCSVSKCSSQAKSLVIPAGQCCPQCLTSRLLSCGVNGTVRRHGETWSMSTCRNCICLNGEVSCKVSTCDRQTTCGRGEVLRIPPGQCCPACVPNGRACWYNRETYKDGDVFELLNCTVCQCGNGEIKCYLKQCSKVTCGEGELSVLLPNTCCRQCLKRGCVDGNQQYQDGEQWEPSACRVCRCSNGKKTCVIRSCPKVNCNSDQWKMTKDGECCPTCVSLGKSCLEKGKEYMNQESWNPSPCKYCICDNGNISCSQASCQIPSCSKGQMLVQPPDQCCPHCALPPGNCSYLGTTYLHDQEWKPDVCRLCYCRNGQVSCFQASCTPCVSGVLSNEVPGQCCPRCESRCSDECLACHNKATNCSACRDSSLWLEEGRCVSGCSSGFYQDTLSKTCQRCHSSCAQCSGSSQRECIACSNGRYLKNNQCVAKCGLGYFVHRQDCRKCHASCIGCTSGGQHKCTSCSDRLAFFKDGRCVSSCGPGHYTVGRNCTGCESSCKTCGPDNSDCTSCHRQLLLKEERCVTHCGDGYFATAAADCEKCHKSCSRCTGIQAVDCLACVTGLLLQNGYCVSSCSDGHYRHRGVCIACDKSCHTCQGPGKSACTSCPGGTALSSTGMCVTNCGKGKFATEESVCADCHASCSSCSGNSDIDCTACLSRHMLRGGQCISACSDGEYGYNGTCQLCHGSCSTCTGGSESDCSTCSLPSRLTTEGRCETGCISGEYEDRNGTCHSCHTSCLQCVLASDGSGSVCVDCRLNKMLKGSQCVDDCGSGYYAKDGRCKGCDASCLTCFGQGKLGCSGCRQGFSLALSGRCVAKCPTGEYSDGKGKCQKCDDSCLTCSGSSTACLECRSPLHVRKYGRCVEQCGDGFYSSEGKIRECKGCRDTCYQCSDTNECSACFSPLLLKDGKCVRSCGNGFYEDNNKCSSCSQHCAQCTSANQCSRCQSSHVLYSGKCITSCPRGFYSSDVTKSCSSCSAKCAECRDSTTCVSCGDGTYLHSGQCVSSCAEGYYGNLQERICEVNVHRPVVIVNGTIVVVIGGSAFIDPLILDATDSDTHQSKLLFQVVRLPTNGRLVKTGSGDRETLSSGATFSRADMIDGIIRYIHNPELVAEGSMAIRVSDRQLTSDVASVEIKVVSAFPPVVVSNNGLAVEELNSKTLSSTNFRVTDQDNLKEVTITAVSGPHYGQLRKGRIETQSFTVEELNRGMISYIHRWGQSPVDFILFQASDGTSVINFLFQVNISLSDNDPPVLITNRQLVVAEGAAAALTTNFLAAHDVDSSDSALVFKIVRGPINGKLFFRKPIPQSGVPGKWSAVPGTGKMQKEKASFRQEELASAQVYYEHSGTETLSDSFEFEVWDKGSPPNGLLGQEFLIVVTPVDDEAPRLASGLQPPLRIIVDEGSVFTITRENLAYEDPDSDNKQLQYRIVSVSENGQLELNTAPNVSVTQFTQADINAGRVLLRLSGSEIGLRQIKSVVRFTVSDGKNTLRSQTLQVIAMPVDNKPPELETSQPLVVDEGGKGKIGLNQLSVSDPDTELADLVYTVSHAPGHGHLGLIRGSSTISLRGGDKFSVLDVVSGLLEYTHDGTETTEDSFSVGVTDGKLSVYVTVQVQITPVDEDRPELVTGVSLHLVVAENSSEFITRRVLAVTDTDTDNRLLLYTLTRDPSRGWLEVRSSPKVFARISTGGQFTQGQINNFGVQYVTLGETGSSDLRDSFMVSVTDKAGNQLSSLKVDVVITSVNSIAPELIAQENISVPEGGRVVITDRNLQVSDADTADKQVICRITVLPLAGFIENVNTFPGSERTGRGLAINAFSAYDFRGGFINYEQNQHEGVEHTTDTFQLQCSDGIHKSAEKTFYVDIQLINDEEPEAETGILFCPENAGVAITNLTVQVSDLDTPDQQLLFTLFAQPEFGEVRRRRTSSELPFRGRLMEAGNTFTVDELYSGLITYTHNGKPANTDRIRFSISDGTFSTDIFVRVVIAAVDDEKPYVTVNNGLKLKLHESALILPEHFHASDIDSDESELTFILKTKPSLGQLVLDKRRHRTVLSVSGVNSFKQADIDSGHVRYIHSKTSGIETLKFDIVDSNGNKLLAQDFIIYIKEDNIPPIVVTNTGLHLKEGESKKLTTQELSGTDSNSDDASLLFYVDTQPLYGQLQRLGSDDTVVEQFTQVDLAAGRIVYSHTNEQESEQDHFQFTLTDGANNVSMMFFITIQPVDDSLPIITNEGLRVTEGSLQTITSFELEAVDADTKAGKLYFSVLSFPQHGSLERVEDSTTSVPAITFSMQDILDNKIRYRHDGSNTIEDSFSFTVSDGTNAAFQFIDSRGQLRKTTSAQVFSISISPVDDGAPRLIVNTGLESLTSVGTLTYSIIRKRNLMATDDDTEDGTLVFTVITAPVYGYIARCHRSQCSESSSHVSSFTQKDINAGHIAYVTGSTNNTRDYFKFSVSDMKPNTLPDQSFFIQWSYVAFEHTTLIVGESDGTATITLRRYGNLNQESFVVCKTQQRLATSLGGVTPRKGKNDYVEKRSQVQFGILEDVKTWSVQIVDDNVYERATEYFLVQLEFPTKTLLGIAREAKVVINDTEDEPIMSFLSPLVGVEEGARVVNVRLTRTGDLGIASSVVCYTDGGTAQGSAQDSLESGSDYVARSKDSSSSRVFFRKGQKEVLCRLRIIDDTLYELAETVHIKLNSPVSGRVGELRAMTVTILGPNDEPKLSLAHQTFTFGEDSGKLSVDVIRTGVDLQHTSLVWCSTREASPPSAEAGKDFVLHSTQLIFTPKETVKPCTVTILDDTEQPKLEAHEIFTIALHMAVGATLSPPYHALVTIDDTADDIPKVSFAEMSYEVNEPDENIAVTVTRTGDLTHELTVRCYTRSQTATVGKDYMERTNTDDSIIRFLPGESSKTCHVVIVNDNSFEPDEVLRLYLGSVHSAVGGEIDQNHTELIIRNPEDVPTVQFERSVYEVYEPASSNQVTEVTVVIIRTGDTNQTSQVRCSTTDGLATSGLDYEPHSELLVFKPRVTRAQFKVRILYSEKIEWEESFTIGLSADSLVNAELGKTDVTYVTIIDQRNGVPIFPDVPKVISLLDYDDASKAEESPVIGYPLVCVTPCDFHHPQFEEMKGLCDTNGVVSNVTRFKWEIAPPADDDGVQQPFSQLDAETVFTSTKLMVLDSIYMCPRCLIRCAAQPSDKSGTMGSWYVSRHVTIRGDKGICHSHNDTLGLLKAESFIANLDYIDTRNLVHSNHMKITIEIPHRDGMLPVVSTRDISDLGLTLSKSSYRHQHVCSNLLDYNEHNGLTTFGFINAISKGEEPRGPGYDFPRQFDYKLRGRNTIRLYQHLNLRTCLWTFEAYYHLNELRDACGGRVTTDFAVSDQVSSQLTVTVPLHVSYVYSNPPVGWRLLGHSTEMSFSFTYSTILWRSGVGAEGVKDGRLQVLQAFIRPSDGRFVITFRTEAKFRGQFVLSHEAKDSIKSYVEPPASVGVGFQLVELFHDNSFDHPTQVWQASSLLSARDYTGKYSFHLIPCSVKSTDSYDKTQKRNVYCTPLDPVKFAVPISFSQVIPPVPENYKLNTLFMLHNSRNIFLSNPFKHDGDLNELDYDGSFSTGDTIYGRVFWNPTQDLRNSFKLRIESVYLCSGKDGFVPYYDPEGRIFKGEPQYGCLRDHSRLGYRFKLIDRKHPDTEDKEFNGVQFQSQLAGDNPAYQVLLDMPGVDGFSLLTEPLYKIEAGRQWFLQVVYSISGISNGITKRDVATMAVSPLKRSLNPTGAPGTENGTDIHFFEVEGVNTAVESGSLSETSVSTVAGAAAGGMVALLAIVFTIVGVIYVRHHQSFSKSTESKQEEPATASKEKGVDRKRSYHKEDEYDDDRNMDEKGSAVDSDDCDSAYNDDYPTTEKRDRTSAHEWSDNEHTEV